SAAVERAVGHESSPFGCRRPAANPCRHARSAFLELPDIARQPLISGGSLSFHVRPMDRLDAMSVLLAAVESGSLSKASRDLRLPLATVSRKVAELEDHLKATLRLLPA